MGLLFLVARLRFESLNLMKELGDFTDINFTNIGIRFMFVLGSTTTIWPNW